ncbi:MAG TPA: hypothetical protein VNY82_19375 [Steroidobacteraceae bacterium]|nr:hypothetical protein [Steroidobacteraceae bacterium]
MPELLQKQVSARSIRVRQLAWTLAALPALTAFPAFAAVESLPASVRACAAETDSLRRLMCYDREVARFPAPAANAAPAPPTASASQPASGASSGATSPAPTPPTTATPQSPPATRAAATTGAQPLASSSNASPPSAENTATAGAGSATHSDPQHLTARIVSIDHRPNELTWHLDNGQVWQEVQSVAGDLSLREGDTVKIDKHLGSYWLSGPHVASMRVRQKD